MTNRNRNKKNKALTKKQVNQNEKHKESGKEEKRLNARIVIEVLPIIISCFALIVSVIALYVNYYFNHKEYEYKIDPEIEVIGRIGLQVSQNGTGYSEESFLEDMQIHILQKHNLQEAYLISPDNTVEKLEIDDMEERLLSKFSQELKMNKADLVFGNLTYQYVFLLLKSLDDTSELYLVYAKSSDEVFEFQAASGIEIWGLANSHPDNPEFAGEKAMAVQYENLLKASEKYRF